MPTRLPFEEIPLHAVHASRLERLRKMLASYGYDGLIVARPENVRYLVGFTGTVAVLLVAGDRAALVVDSRYAAQASQEVAHLGGSCQVVHVAGAAYEVAVKEGLRLVGLAGRRRRVGFESHHVTVATARLWEAVLPCRLDPIWEPVEVLRAVKDPTEIDAIRRAARITGEALDQVLPLAVPGMREDHLAAALVYHMRLLGADGTAFEPMVASGARTAQPHARPGPGTLTAGGLVWVDWGARVDGYAADATRTWVVGGAPDVRQRAVIAAVQEALQAAIAAVQPGVPASRVDAAARRVLKGHRLAGAFPHGLGHALGLEIHEDPGLRPGEGTPLEEGMVLALEPGAYLPGWGGVRLEQTVLVTRTGSEVLTTFPLLVPG